MLSNEKVEIPLLPKSVSGVPSAPSRTTAIVVVFVWPATTAFPSGWIATAKASSLPPVSIVRDPVPLKLESTVPFVVRRTTTMSRLLSFVGLVLTNEPATTILPSAWRASALAWAARPNVRPMKPRMAGLKVPSNVPRHSRRPTTS